MEQKRSYKVQEVSGDVEVEILRLKAQVELFWSKELRRYRDYGIENAGSVIELGSGPGFVLERLLNEFSDINVVGLEIDEFLYDRSKEYLRSFGNRCEIMQGNIMDTGLEDNSFDFAISRLVIEHLPDPVGAIKEVLRILKPGGKAIFIDNDFEMHNMTYPGISELRDLYQAYCESRRSEGGNPTIGRQLPTLLKEGGFCDIDFEVICAHSGIQGFEPFSRSEGVGIPTKLVQDGFLSSKILGTLSSKWRDMLAREDSALLRQLYMGIGVKPQSE